MSEGLASIRVDGDRAQFGDAVTEADLRHLAERAHVTTLQCSAPVRDSVWALLNEAFFPLRPDVELRVYGHYSATCDLSFAARLSNVRRFAADSLMRATNVDAIADMPALDSLSLGIHDLQDYDVLARVSPSLTSLEVGPTLSKKPSLEHLGRFRLLKRLFIEGHTKQLDVVGELRNLEDVTLRSITTPDLRYLAPLERLRSLAIKLGGIRSFEGVEAKASIRNLELWQISGLERVEAVGSLPGLQNLFLQSLPRVQTMPHLTGSRSLRRVVLGNMKGLADFSVFESAPALDQFALLDGGGQQPEQLLPVLRNPVLSHANAWFGSARRNEAFAKLRASHGKKAWDISEPFPYR